MRKIGSTVHVRIGNPISPKQLERFGDIRELVDYLRLRTGILARRHSALRANGRDEKRNLEKVVSPMSSSSLQLDVCALPGSQRLVTSGDFEVYYAWAPQAPQPRPQPPRRTPRPAWRPRRPAPTRYSPQRTLH